MIEPLLWAEPSSVGAGWPSRSSPAPHEMPWTSYLPPHEMPWTSYPECSRIRSLSTFKVSKLLI